MGIRSLSLLALAVLAAGCSTTNLGNSAGSLPGTMVDKKPVVGTGTGRFLVISDYDLAYAQFEVSSTKLCSEYRAVLSKRMTPTGAQKLDCESTDQRENLPYSVFISDTAGSARVSTFNQSMCDNWTAVMASTPGVKVEPGGCPASPPGVKGKRFLQVQDGSRSVLAQFDLGTESNCKQFYKLLGQAALVCTDDNRSPEMQYTARMMGERDLPMLEVETRDKALCEVLAKETAKKSPGVRPECRFKG